MYVIMYEHEKMLAQVDQHEDLMKEGLLDRKILGILILASREKLKNFLNEEKYIDKIHRKYSLGKVGRYGVMGEVYKW